MTKVFSDGGVGVPLEIFRISKIAEILEFPRDLEQKK
jgi:hypothetical protein